MTRRARKLTVRMALTALVVVLRAGTIDAQKVNLADASLEDLMNIRVTSISKKEQDLFASASAVYVVTAEHLRRSGATSVADALRMVPGVTVGQLSGSSWRIGVRGFSGQFSDKLLVLVDGMSVYEPTFGGVWWGTFEPSLDSIERIEVIRGPGAVVWGANAVNGVINIITKEARATQGSTVSATLGTEAGAGTTARYGGRVGSLGYYRFEATGVGDGRIAGPGAQETQIQRRTGTAALRMDLEPSGGDRWQIQALASVNRHYEAGVVTDLASPTFTSPYARFEPGRFLSGMAQWTHQSQPGTSSSLRFYGLLNDHSAQKVDSSSTLLGVEALRHLQAGRHDLVVSADARRLVDRARPGPIAVFSPERHRGYQVTAFAQDEITLVPSRLTFTAGAKIGDSDLTTTSVEPNVRLAWTPAASTTLWAAFSGADRIPTRFSLDGLLTFGNIPEVVPGMLTLLQVQGTRALRSESLRAYEAGYRVRLGSHAVIDTVAFVNRYDGLVGTSDPAVSVGFDPVPYILLSSVFENKAPTTARGVETLVQGRLGNLRLDGSYSFLASDVLGYLPPDPRHTGTLGGTFQVAGGWEAGARLFMVSEIVPVSPLARVIPSYNRLDIRLARSIRKATFSVVGQNLTRDSHSESDGSLGTVIPMRRSVHATVAWQF